MKTEDIDKRIGMPDVDKEWARFEQEVISGGTKRRSALTWAVGIGIAASVALLLIFNIGKKQEEQAPLIVQTEEIKPQPTPQPEREEVQAKEQEAVTKVPKPVIAHNKKLALAKANAPAASSLDIPAREYTGTVQKFKMDDIEDLAFESVDQALQNQNAVRDIAAADLGSGTTMHLRGIGDNNIDSFLVVINGKTLFDSRGMTSEEIDRRIEEYLNEQGLLQDIKIPWKNGALEIYASTPEEREERQRMIANATIVPNPSYLGSGTNMRLQGTGDYGPSDKNRLDSTLILVNGEPLPENLQREVLGSDPYYGYDAMMPRYFSRQGMLIDSVYVHKDSYYTEKYGGRAKYGLIEIKTVPDTYCDAYVRKHPKLMKKYTKVEGYIMDNDGKPLTEAWVHIKGDLIGTPTDSTGHFVFWVPKKKIELCADQTGYKTVEFLPSETMLVKCLEPDTNTNNMNLRLRGNSQELITSVAEYVPEENEVRLLPQGVIGGSHDSPPNDSILYLVNGVPQPKENNKWLGRKSYLEYFKGQHMLVTRVIKHPKETTQRYVEKYGEAAKHGVVEYFCVEDTLCDYYMDQHKELKASRRRVSGVVYDENDEPLAHTMIYILHGKKIWGFETTDSLGNFTFWVPRTDVKLNFTYVGFYKAVVVEPSDTFQTIYLLPNDNLQSLRKNIKF